MNKFYRLVLFIISSCCIYSAEYYTYDKIDSTLHAWDDTFGNNPHPSDDYSGFGIIYELKTIGYSSQDSLPIYAVKLSANAKVREPEPKVLILGQCHAEEIYGVEIAMEIINQFIHPHQYQSNKSLLQKGLYYTELWIVPTHNPEGLNVVHGWERNGEYLIDPTYRKNIRDVIDFSDFNYQVGVGNDSDGVDLNRNYNFNWSFGDTLLEPCAGDCSSYNDEFDYYRGENPESELETQAIVKLAREQNFLLSLSYHSSRSGRIDRYVIYPWAWKDKCACDDPDLKQYSPGFNVIEKLGSEIAEITGTDIGQNYLQTGSSYRKGNAHDWLYRETGCIQYLIEVGYIPDYDYAGGLLIQDIELDKVMSSNLDAFFHVLMRAVGENYSAIDHNQVKGVITDVTNGRPIKNVNIFIPQLETDITKPRITDTTGFYARLLHPNESYSMSVSAFGYETIDTTIAHSSANAKIIDLALTPLPLYNIEFNIVTPNNESEIFQLIRHHILQSDTFNIVSGDIQIWPQGNYKLIFTGSDYAPTVFAFEISEETELELEFIYEEIILESEEKFYINETGDGYDFPINNIASGSNLLIELKLRYDLEWEYDYFIISYINSNNETELARYTGDYFEYFTEYIPFTLPDEHANGKIVLDIDKDNTIDYRGIEIDYIKIMKGSEASLTNNIFNVSNWPDQFHLYQNYPNPFNPTTNIQFYVPNLSPVSISIYDIQGKIIEQLVNDVYEPGYYSTYLNAEHYSSGIYFYRLQTENSILTRKLIIIK